MAEIECPDCYSIEWVVESEDVERILVKCSNCGNIHKLWKPMIKNT